MFIERPRYLGSSSLDIIHQLHDVSLLSKKSHPVFFTFIYIHLYVFLYTILRRKILLDKWNLTKCLNYLKRKKCGLLISDSDDDDDANIY